MSSPPSAVTANSPQPSPLPAALVTGRTPSLKEPLLQEGQLFWLEQRPQEQGRTTLMHRLATGEAIELTPAPWNLRSRVHEYGGGAYALAGPDLVFVHDGDRCLWHQQLRGDAPETETQAMSLTPQRLTAPGERAFGGGLIDAPRRRWIGVMEAGGRDELVAVSLAGGEPQRLHQPADFCGYPALSPDGRQLAWVEWQQPSMPWQRSQLWLAELDGDGALQRIRPVAGDWPEAISVFQPLWISTSELVVARDDSGWWNLHRFETGSGHWQPLLPMRAEFAMPQWVFGMRTTSWDGQQLIAAACCDGLWLLGRVDLDPGRLGTAAAWQPLAIPFDDLAALSAEAGRLVAVASSPTTPEGLLELELAAPPEAGFSWRHQPLAACPLPLEAISKPELLWFTGHGGARTQAWYYPPAGGAHGEAPLLVKGHSGPTSMARRGLSLGVQFWTSRGWGVVDVNYGGSTGFGRAYRERLDGQWGVVDVADCAAAAEALVAAGKASSERIAIEGGSAGGFTALAALCFTDVFRAGASRYGVSDPSALASETHRFEARYLDGLIGPWPVASDTYAARSPLQHADRICCPVIFFQGLDDVVVPPEQTDLMAAALQANGIPVEVHRFSGEGHGFRSSATQIQVLEATEAFFRKQFLLP